ncbi:hypothetical protein [Polaribacter sp. SA4-10]|nr:hypothetical protein [Polaribacter sp. SA4-10]
MREETETSSIASSNKNSNYAVKKESFRGKFINWFRNFLENAE